MLLLVWDSLMACCLFEADVIDVFSMETGKLLLGSC